MTEKIERWRYDGAGGLYAECDHCGGGIDTDCGCWTGAYMADERDRVRLPGIAARHNALADRFEAQEGLMKSGSGKAERWRFNDQGGIHASPVCGESYVARVDTQIGAKRIVEAFNALADAHDKLLPEPVNGLRSEAGEGVWHEIRGHEPLCGTEKEIRMKAALIPSDIPFRACVACALKREELGDG